MAAEVRHVVEQGTLLLLVMGRCGHVSHGRKLDLFKIK